MKTLLTLAALLLAGAAHADQITLLATMGNKALISIDGKRHTIAIGQRAGPARLVKLDGESAVFDVNGKQRRLRLGEGYISGNDGASQTGTSLVLSPDAAGHYFTEVSINGKSARGVIDTGATHLSMSVSQAQQFGIDYTKGEPAQSQTANGMVKAWLLQLPQVRIGDITVFNVTVGVRDGGDGAPLLLGASLLNRFQMKRDQELMILTKKAY